MNSQPSALDLALANWHHPGEARPIIVCDRDGRERGRLTGGVRPCQLSGCSGQRVAVRWPDGTLTWPCLKGMMKRADGQLQIRPDRAVLIAQIREVEAALSVTADTPAEHVPGLVARRFELVDQLGGMPSRQELWPDIVLDAIDLPGLPDLVVRALRESVVGIGQLTKAESALLDRYVRQGVITKGQGGPYPTPKTVYARPNYDFAAEREHAITHLLARQ